MAILILRNGAIREFRLPTVDKDQALYDLWSEINKKKIKIKDANGKVEEIKIVDIDNCLIGEEEKKYKRRNKTVFYYFDKAMAEFDKVMDEFGKVMRKISKKENFYE